MSIKTKPNVSTKKPTKSTQPTKRNLHIFRYVCLAIIIAIAGYFVYQKYLDYADKDKFMTLRQDVQALQVEFNKIDKGWEYSEGCLGQGGCLRVT